MKAELLLSDKFAEFTESIGNLRKLRHELVEEFKKAHEAFKTKVSEIEKQAEELESAFQSWQTAQQESQAKAKK
jgi:hypothetical protein